MGANRRDQHANRHEGGEPVTRCGGLQEPHGDPP
jgi:hypothetical protein